MNYQRIYDEFIADRLAKWPDRRKGAQGREVHHIQPRSLGGSNKQSNKISLLYSDHLFAHVLLARIHGGKMSNALVFLLRREPYRGKRSRQLYEIFRTDAAKFQAQRAYDYDVLRANLEKAHTPEARAKMAASLTGVPWSPARRAAGGIYTRTDEHKAKSSAKQRGKTRKPWSAERRAKGQPRWTPEMREKAEAAWTLERRKAQAERMAAIAIATNSSADRWTDEKRKAQGERLVAQRANNRLGGIKSK